MTPIAALISNGIVVHVAVCDEDWASAQGYTFITDNNSHEKLVNIGDTYDEANEVFIPQGWSYDAELDEFVAPVIEESI